MTGLVSLGRAALAAIVLTVVLGFAYPAVITAAGRLGFTHEAEGSLLRAGGTVIGSRLAAQPFSSPGTFHPRPSATSPAYNAGGTTFDNLGPSSPVLLQALRSTAAAVVRLERPYNPGLTTGDVPVDAVTTSASGIDPHISLAYAHLQARRVAHVRGLSLSQVEHLISASTDGRSLGFFGEPGVNVLALNIALDSASKEKP